MERYRSMRTYKRERSVVNVSRLIAYRGNHLSDGLNLASIIIRLHPDQPERGSSLPSSSYFINFRTDTFQAQVLGV
jgi:hypothetical protein